MSSNHDLQPMAEFADLLESQRREIIKLLAEDRRGRKIAHSSGPPDEGCIVPSTCLNRVEVDMRREVVKVRRAALDATASEPDNERRQAINAASDIHQRLLHIVTESAAGMCEPLDIDLRIEHERAVRHLRDLLPLAPSGAVAGASDLLPKDTTDTVVKKPPKRSTQRGDGRTKLISALTMHHQYADGGCLNQEPVSVSELARLARVAKSTASVFFTDKFGGHDQYMVCCRVVGNLVAELKVLNGEFSPFKTMFEVEPPLKPDRRRRGAGRRDRDD